MKIGFIGAGNMATAIIKGICYKKLYNPKDILVFDTIEEKMNAIAEELGVCTSLDNEELVKQSDILFLCVKPQVLELVIDEIKDDIKKDPMIVSIAAGKSLEFLQITFNKDLKLVRVMPNTPALVGEGISAICPNARASEDNEALEQVINIFNSLGESEIVKEDMIDIAGQIAGASPAWISMVIEAMADGAVHEGMSREMAYKFASAGVAGAGKLALEFGGNPSIIKDMCSSPKGTTIEGIKVLEERGVRGAFMDAVIEACEKSRRI